MTVTQALPDISNFTSTNLLDYPQRILYNGWSCGWEVINCGDYGVIALQKHLEFHIENFPKMNLGLNSPMQRLG